MSPASLYSQTTRRLAALLLGLSLVGSLKGQLAQPTEPAALTTLRSKYAALARSSTTALNLYYANYLNSMELMAATAGDYELALQAVRRREALAIAMGTGPTPSGSAATPASSDSIEIIGSAERFVGGVSLTAGSLEGWRSSASGVELVLRSLTAGKYYIELSYTFIPPEITGSSTDPEITSAMFYVRDASLLRSDNIQKLSLSVTEDDTPGSVRSAGLLDLSQSPPITLRLVPAGTLAGAKVSIKSIKLISAASANATATGVAGMPAMPMPATGAGAASATSAVTNWADELEALRRKHEERLLALRKPLAEAYSLSLHALESTAKDEAELDRIHEEENRVERFAHRPKPPPRPDSIARAPGEGLPGKPPRRRSEMLDLEGFQVLEGARFQPDPASTGDRIKVTHDSQPEPFWVRLAWVAAPGDPTAAEDKRHANLAAERFGASPADAAQLVVTAKDFTAVFLEGRPLQISTRGRKAKDGSLMALVFIDDIGLYQNVLLDQGLAVVEAPPQGKANSRIEENILESLREHERAAQAKQPPVGGWTLRDTSAPTATAQP